MRATKLFVAATFFAAALSAFGSNPPPVNIPDWVEVAASQPKDSYTDDTNAVVLLDDTSIRVNTADEYVRHNRRVVRILRPEGRGEATFAVYVRSLEKIVDLHAWSLDASGHKFEVKMKEFALSNLYEEELYSDYHLFKAKVPGGDVGSVVAFEYELVKHPYKPEINWIPQEDVPVKETSFTVEFPTSYEYSSAWANSDEIKPQQVAANKWKWSLNDLPALQEEPLRPSFGALTKRLEIAFYGSGVSSRSGSWAAIGTWYKGLTEQRRVTTPEISEAARRVTAGKVGFDAQVRAIANFLQRDVRYVAISIGIGGYQPHFANDVFRHKYGDCKDKAALMSTMLKELGYRSEMVLVDTERGVVKPMVPSGYFDHAIIAIELPKDISDATYPSMVKTKSGVRYVIFDPTNEYTPFGLIPSYEQTSYVLIATDPGELVQLPLLTPELNTNERAGKFKLDSDGVLSGEVVQKFAGDEASDMRHRLVRYDGNDRAKFLEASASASLKQASVENAEFQNLKDIDSNLVIKYEVKMPGYAQNAGGLLLVRPRVFGDKAIHLPKKARKYSIELEGSRHDHDVYEIKLPAGYVVDELPDSTHIDVGFAMYDSKIEAVGDTIRYTREYVIREPNIELSKLDEVRRLESAIGSDQFANAVLKKAP
jgi:hypothetical protein